MLICLTCINDSFTDRIDLCTGCIGRSCQRDGFVHDPSHVLLKFDSIVLDGRLRHIIPAARSMIARIREEFRSSVKDRIEPVEKSGLSHSSQSRKEASKTAAPPNVSMLWETYITTLLGLRNLPCVFLVSYPLSQQLLTLAPAVDAYVCDDCDGQEEDTVIG